MFNKISTETKIFLVIIIGTIALIAGASLLLGNKSDDKNGPKVDQAVLVRPESHYQGPKDAKVTIVEFSDFQCPACKAAQPTVNQVLQKYQSQVRFVYRNYPLQAHEFGFIAAQAVESAGLQGKFWETHDKLFEKSPDLSKEKLINYAQELGLNMAKFSADQDSDAVRQVVLNDQADGNTAGITVTPTFFINGTKFDGSLSFNEFSKEIDSRLK